MDSPTDVRRKCLEFAERHGNDSVICFDFFDTLITRSVMPEYTKKIAAKQLSQLLKGQVEAHKLYAIRSSLEAEICSKNQKNGFDLEFNLIELAERLFAHLKKSNILALDSFSREEFIQVVLDLEIVVEKRVQVPCQDMVTLLKDLKCYGGMIILASDFYLPKPLFADLLQFHNLSDSFDHVYISCEYLITKGSGRLYNLISKEHGIKKDSMLMIGDNSHADKLMAEKQGIRALLIDREYQFQKYQEWEKKLQNQLLLQEKLVGVIRQQQDTVFPEMGLILWYFAHRLFNCLLSDGVKDVVFLSREGEFLRSLFISYQTQLFGREKIRSHYLIASRKSTYVASLKALPEERFHQLFAQYRDISPRDFLLSLNFTNVQCQSLCALLGINAEEKIIDFPESSIFFTILESDMFQDLFEYLRNSQKNNFKKYIQTFGVDFRRNGLNIVDVGWKGSMQGNINNILDDTIEVSGYYLGLLSAPASKQQSSKTGILFSETPMPSQFFSVYNNNRSLFEMVLGASHGSGEGYFLSQQEIDARDNGMLYGIYSERGKEQIYVAVAEEKQEKQLFLNAIGPLQEGIRHVFEEVNKNILSTPQTAPPEDWFAGQHGRMVFLPRKREIDFYESLYHLENFGVFEFTTFSPDEKSSLLKRIINLKAVLTDPQLLEIGFWPPVILNHLGIGAYRYLDGICRYKKVFGLRRLLCILGFC